MPVAVLLILLQSFTQRGFVETQGIVYPQDAINDKVNVIGEVQIRYEAFYKPWSSFQIAGALDLRSDTHDQTERELRLDWDDRGRRRPLLSLQRLTAQYYH